MRTKPNEIRPPGYMLRDLNEEFMKEWAVNYAEHQRTVEARRRKLGHNHPHESKSPTKNNTLRSQLSKGLTAKLDRSASKGTRQGSLKKGGHGDGASHRGSDDGEPIDEGLERELLGKLGRQITINMTTSKKSRQDAKIKVESGSSVAKSLADGLGAVGEETGEYGSPHGHFEGKRQSRDPRKVVIEKLKNPALEDTQIFDMKASMQRIASKNRVNELLEATYKRNRESVQAAKKNDSTK